MENELSYIPEVSNRSPVAISRLSISEEQVRKKLELLKADKSSGPDDVSPRLLPWLVGWFG